MADDIDRANEYVARLNDEALSQRVHYSGHSSEYCIDCGDPIPEERREAIRGCKTCFPCAEARERRMV